MSERRRARLNEQIKREISELVRSEVHDPRVGVPTVTAVDVTADLWLARVYVRAGAGGRAAPGGGGGLGAGGGVAGGGGGAGRAGAAVFVVTGIRGHGTLSGPD
ncbi:MAG: ribosome-binding factor A, partial [Gammaproteobacteria bacterium]|nr:ribosome-binding factor A [Gammaproteobacteria bacterium]